jgi:hypothetical protein
MAGDAHSAAVIVEVAGPISDRPPNLKEVRGIARGCWGSEFEAGVAEEEVAEVSVADADYAVKALVGDVGGCVDGVGAEVGQLLPQAPPHMTWVVSHAGYPLDHAPPSQTGSAVRRRAGGRAAR